MLSKRWVRKIMLKEVRILHSTNLTTGKKTNGLLVFSFIMLYNHMFCNNQIFCVLTTHTLVVSLGY